MLSFPSFEEISLWLAILAAVMLITYQFLYSYHGKSHILIEKGPLKTIAIVFGIMFLLTALIEIYSILVS